ncbi:hypothetical protein [Terricaulis sp.]|uniref:hypothetical protein n=1 Tax=Terricaulis sp. TaxID=2768686 RepID=UPI002AC3C1EB|nr:hypothetical protein [Terricaulis sp.]MDZ4692599.1 hypothetical protein [Terricaulis sp.]
MDIGTLISIIMIYGAGLLAGWGIILILLWIRPEYGFLLFYVIANHVLVFLLFDIWRLTLSEAPQYALYTGINLAFALVIGGVIVTLFKWLKTRKTGADKNIDKEMERIRAEIAARDQSAT